LNRLSIAAGRNCPIFEPHTYWGKPFSEFTLRTSFQIPEDWEAHKPSALHLPIGDAGNFSHRSPKSYQTYA
jgi:hypothetical protein